MKNKIDLRASLHIFFFIFCLIIREYLKKLLQYKSQSQLIRLQGFSGEENSNDKQMLVFQLLCQYNLFIAFYIIKIQSAIQILMLSYKKLNKGNNNHNKIKYRFNHLIKKIKQEQNLS
ncbi:unnamed protein product [Paramecium sonneborni]|uniref:Transmembrane protein n=1 Tax=Paramecium sonneborni TaxID=65129 RepID=A0A8S1L3X3_9CILI|nr:unnamed protein product [Paramecium sonneborni]